MMNIQANFMNLFLPVGTGTKEDGLMMEIPILGDVNAIDSDFLKLFLESSGSGNNEKSLFQAGFLGQENLSENTPTGSIGLSDVNILNLENNQNPVFEADGAVSKDQTNPAKSTVWDQYITSKGWKIGTVRSDSNGPANGKIPEGIIAGRIEDSIDQQNVLKGWKTEAIDIDAKNQIVNRFFGRQLIEPNGQNGVQESVKIDDSIGRAVLKPSLVGQTGLSQAGAIESKAQNDTRIISVLEKLAEQVGLKEIDIISNQASPKLSGELKASPDKLFGHVVMPDNPARAGMLNQVKSDESMTVKDDFISLDKITETKNAVKSVNNDSLFGESKDGMKQNPEPGVFSRASNNIATETARPALSSAEWSDKAALIDSKTEVGQVRFVLPENIKDNGLKPGHTVTLRMEPEHLGRIRLTLSTYNDSLMGRIVVESSAARQVLESNMHVLQNQLANEGLSLEQFQVSVGGEEARQSLNSRFGKTGNFSNDGTIEKDSAESSQSANETQSSARQNYVGSGGVDWLA